MLELKVHARMPGQHWILQVAQARLELTIGLYLSLPKVGGATAGGHPHGHLSDHGLVSFHQALFHFCESSVRLGVGTSSSPKLQAHVPYSRPHYTYKAHSPATAQTLHSLHTTETSQQCTEGGGGAARWCVPTDGMAGPALGAGTG